LRQFAITVITFVERNTNTIFIIPFLLLFHPKVLGFSVKQFYGYGDFSFSIKEHISFLEVDYDKISKIRGMDINIITSAVSDKEARELLLAFRFPFFFSIN
jgi:ribosomal protein L5